MMFYSGADVLIRSRLVFSNPRLPTSFTLSFSAVPFNCFFLAWRPVLRFLENITQCFQWFKSCLDVFAVQNPSNSIRHSFIMELAHMLLGSPRHWLCDVSLTDRFNEVSRIVISFKVVNDTSPLGLSLRSR